MDKVRLILAKVRKELNELPYGTSYDPCDTEEECCGWVENELGLFEDLWVIYRPDFQKEDFGEFDSLKWYAYYIRKQSEEYRKALGNFIVNGGTGINNIFEVRTNKNRREVARVLGMK